VPSAMLELRHQTSTTASGIRETHKKDRSGPRAAVSYS
jgi:hypothetical protein